MPGKIRNDDWERLFGPNVPRRGGPLQVLGHVLLALVLIGGLVTGTMFLLRYQAEQQQTAVVRATTLAATTNPLATATTVARTATAVAQATAQAVVTQPTVVPELGRGQVIRGGNLRREPVVDETNVLGLIWPGDEISFLEQRDVNGQTWFRVRIMNAAANRGGQGVDPGIEGWASGTLLSGL